MTLADLAVTYPYVLLLLPLAALPLVWPAQEAEGYPSLGAVTQTDTLSAFVDLALRLLGALAIAGLVLGLAGLHRLGQSIERLGEGANIVLLFDRSASMNDSFAGRTPTGGEESKSAAARRFLKDFVTRREHDRFGISAFSTSPMFVLPLSEHKEATLGAIDAIELPGLAYTNVGKGLAMALSLHDADMLATQGADEGVASRAIVLVSDGAAVIDRKVQQILEASFTKRPISLYWIFLRTEGSRGLFDPPPQGMPDTPAAMPERHLNLFFENLKIPYKAFEVEDPAAVGEAVAAIDKLERSPMRYEERIPQKDLSGLTYGVSAVSLLLLVLAKLSETRLAEARPAGARPAGARPAQNITRGPNALLAFLALSALLAATLGSARAAELTREQVLVIIAASGEAGKPDLSRKDLTGIDLSGVDFKGADLFAANLSGSMLQRANFAGANMNRTVANEADFSDANFTKADMFAVVMNGSELTGADFSWARVIGELKNARMNKAKLVGADLGADPANQGMVPVRVDMSGVSLEGADLTDANLIHTVLTFANLRDAKLVNTKFNWAKLAGANLGGADVTGADFTDADLDGTSLSGLKGADSAKGLPKGQ
jgi:mxaC protein